MTLQLINQCLPSTASYNQDLLVAVPQSQDHGRVRGKDHIGNFFPSAKKEQEYLDHKQIADALDELYFAGYKD